VTDGAEKKLRVGVMSFAHMHAYSYARAVCSLPDAQLVGVADDDEARGKAAAEQYGIDYFNDIEQLLDSGVDAVIVCSENARHRDHVVAAARAGAHVLCEKPIAADVCDGAEMIEACRAAGVVLATAFPVRHVPAVARTKQLVEEGKIGKVLAVKATNHGRMPGGWFIEPDLSGGGAVIDHTVHVADLLRWILNDEFKSVYAEIDTRFYDFDIDDCGTLCLEMENGVFATLDPSWSRPRTYPTWGDVMMEIIGTDGVISLNAFAQCLVEASDSQGAVVYRGWGDNSDLALVADFVSAAREGRRPAADGVDGLRALEVALAAYESSRLGEVVALDKLDC